MHGEEAANDERDDGEATRNEQQRALGGSHVGSLSNAEDNPAALPAVERLCYVFAKRLASRYLADWLAAELRTERARDVPSCALRRSPPAP
jgi:hypothetical protein